MKIYLQNTVKQLKQFSKTLDKTSILIDKPWALIDSEFALQKLIFRKNKELILSRDGIVQVGKWDYFPEAKSLLIDRGVDTLLFREEFIEEGVLILRRDGIEDDYIVLANENIIPDLDINKYLRKLRQQKLQITGVLLKNGEILEIRLLEGYQYLGGHVTIESNDVENGLYQANEENIFYEINNGVISNILTSYKYINPLGDEIAIIQKNNWVSYGDRVFIHDKPIENGVILFSKIKKIVIENGIIASFEYNNKILHWINKHFLE